MEIKMKLGDSVKVHLDGESPWAEVTKILPDGFLGRIDNTLINDYPAEEKAKWKRHHGFDMPVTNHGYHCDDIVYFVNSEGVYVPKELNLSN
jgi:hypothetical protein